MALKFFLLSFFALVAVQSWAAPMIEKRDVVSFCKSSPTPASLPPCSPQLTPSPPVNSSVYTSGTLINVQTFAWTTDANPPATGYTPGSQQTTPTSTLTLTFSATDAHFTVSVGAHAATAELIERKAAGSPGGDPNLRHTFLKYIFHDCILESYEVSEKSGELLATVEIKFGTLSTEYTQQNPTAGAVIPIAGWSQVTNMASASSV